MSKGLLEKLGLVESVEDGQAVDYAAIARSVSNESAVVTPAVNVDVTGLVAVADIYQSAGLSDTTKSIFKIKEMKDALPANLPDATKKASIVPMLSVVGLDMAELLDDASKRTASLDSALASFTEETVGQIEFNDSKIAELKAAIADLEKRNEDRKLLQSQQEAVIKDEAKKINDIVNFLK